MVELETTVSTTSTTTNITLVGDLLGSAHLEGYRIDGIRVAAHFAKKERFDGVFDSQCNLGPSV